MRKRHEKENRQQDISLKPAPFLEAKIVETGIRTSLNPPPRIACEG